MAQRSSKVKVFCTFSSDAYKKDKRRFDKFINILENRIGFTIEYHWFDDIDNDDYEGIFENSLTYLKNADIVIAEASIQSISVGQQLALSRQLKKPTLVCIAESESKVRSTILEGSKGSSFKIIHYKDTSDLADKIYSHSRKMLENGRNTLVKFNFIATKQIKEVISKISKSSGRSQSEILREIMTKWIEQGKEDGE